jgi:hypothetical protein
MSPISAMIAELPTKADWNAGISAICAELKALNRPPKQCPRHRASVPPRTWHSGRHQGRPLEAVKPFGLPIQPEGRE